MLKARIVTAIVLLGLFLGALFYLPPAGWLGGTALVASLALWEWGGLMKRPHGERMVLALLVFVFCIAVGASLPQAFLVDRSGVGQGDALWETGKWFYYPAAVFWVMVVPVWLKQRWALSNRLVGYATGLLVVLPAWAALTQLRQLGGLWFLSVMALVWIADIAAYFAGRAFGRHKLAPAISPGKTWEGAIGGGVGVILYGFVLSSKLPQALAGNLPLLVSSLIVLTAVSIVGDLFESLLKRQAGLKDSSNLLPGHGGVLDRIDSLTSTLPLVALVWFSVGL